MLASLFMMPARPRRQSTLELLRQHLRLLGQALRFTRFANRFGVLADVFGAVGLALGLRVEHLLLGLRQWSSRGDLAGLFGLPGGGLGVASAIRAPQSAHAMDATPTTTTKTPTAVIVRMEVPLSWVIEER